MLSKLRYDASESQLNAPRQEELAEGLAALFGTELADLMPLPGGTLGICFKAKLRGQLRFFKTHAIPSGRSALRREVAFLDAVAQEAADPHLLETGDAACPRVWLHTKLLEPGAPPSPTQISRLIVRYEAGLKEHPCLGRDVPVEDNIHHLLAQAEEALYVLSKEGFLSVFVRDAAAAGIERLKPVLAALPLQLCHGDLGPANIMSSGDELVALDWEDVFWGVAGYDYLYWMTFFGNRKWLSQYALGNTILDRSSDISLMVVILLLKSLLSVRNGHHIHNSLSIDDRLLEVINLG